MCMRAVLLVLRLILLIGRCHAVYKQTMNIAKGVGVGLLAGATVAAISSRAMNGSHKKAAHMKKNASRAIHTVGSLIGDMEKMLK